MGVRLPGSRGKWQGLFDRWKLGQGFWNDAAHGAVNLEAMPANRNKPVKAMKVAICFGV